MKRFRVVLLVIVSLVLVFNESLIAIQLIYKDNKGRYHYKCTDKVGGRAIIKYQAEGVLIDGPIDKFFIPFSTVALKRSKNSIKTTEHFARMGCHEFIPPAPPPTDP